MGPRAAPPCRCSGVLSTVAGPWHGRSFWAGEGVVVPVDRRAGKILSKAEANVGDGNTHTDSAFPRCSEDFLLRAFEFRFQFCEYSWRL